MCGLNLSSEVLSAGTNQIKGMNLNTALWFFQSAISCGALAAEKTGREQKNDFEQVGFIR